MLTMFSKVFLLQALLKKTFVLDVARVGDDELIRLLN